MLRVVVGRFRDELAAEEALREFKTLHPEIEPLVARHVHARPIIAQGILPASRRLDMVSSAIGIVGILLGVAFMVMLGQIGRAALALPLLLGLSWVAMVILGWEAIRTFHVPVNRQRRTAESRTEEFIEVIVNTSEALDAEHIFSRAGADEIALRRAA